MRILVYNKIMKKLSTISLFIFAVIVIAILTAGLVFYQNKKDITGGDTQNQNANQVTSSQKFSLEDVAKHSTEGDCWIIIEGKVYNITSYFGKHPGGNDTMSATCGKDATNAYKTRDSYATSSGSKTEHSKRAQNLLDNYYIGNLQ